MRLAYLYSRYPVLSQTFCDMEMLELERRGDDLLIASVHPPLTSLRHEHIARFRRPAHYAPPSAILRLWEKQTRDAGRWPDAMVERHERDYGPEFKAALRARNASYFAELFVRHEVEHLHVHFANRAAHTALFVKEMSGIPFSITAHGQDFMKDLGQDDLLREICSAAKFVAAETDYSRDLLRKLCPDAAPKIHRVYNGLDLSRLPVSPITERPPGPINILSIGRLVSFKGFEILLEACAELDRRNFDFRCRIIGDGPLRGKLEAFLKELNMGNRVTLCGALSQAEVFAQLQACDIFALACVVDNAGASDVFPTVIMEAMACARPVVSTKLAGIPELVGDGTTGLLVPPGDWEEFARALEKLVRNPDLRARLGQAGRKRMEEQFVIAKTIEPLRELLGTSGDASSSAKPKAKRTTAARKTAYLIEQWPDKNLPFLEMELRALQRNEVPHIPLVLCPPSEDLPPKTQDLVLSFQYLPDAMVIEAEWQENQSDVRELETLRANQKHRPSSELFLEQARAALMLRTLFRQHAIGHVHATGSRTLLCALFLKKLLGVSISVAIEDEPVFTEQFLAEALNECVGGRSKNRELLARRSSGFLFDEALDRPSVNEIGPWLSRKAKIEWAGARSFWEEWSQRLKDWTQAS